MEWNDNMYIKEFITDNRDSNEQVQSLSVKVKAYKRDELTTITGDGNALSYNDQSKTVKTVSGKDYFDFDNATVLAERSFTFWVPSDQLTDETESTNFNEYFSKYKQWRKTYGTSEQCDTCYNSLWSDLETMNVSW